jgi:hypothetical protein
MREFIAILSLAVLLIAAGCNSVPLATQVPTAPVTSSSSSPSESGCQVGRRALTNGTITIRPGETLCVQLQPQGDSIAPVALLTSPTPDALILTLKQDQAPMATMLTVHNPLPTPFVRRRSKLWLWRLRETTYCVRH